MLEGGAGAGGVVGPAADVAGGFAGGAACPNTIIGAKAMYEINVPRDICMDLLMAIQKPNADGGGSVTRERSSRILDAYVRLGHDDVARLPHVFHFLRSFA